MLPGTFAIFFPNDAHMPLVSQGKEFKLTKLVVKVRV
jgi:beta-galactosidase beta subunit